MVELGVLAYPVLMGAMYGVYRIGRGERWEAYEWLRLCVLALIMGIVIAVQVRFAFLGYIQDPWTVAAALASIGGTGGLIGLYIWQEWQQRAAEARAAHEAAMGSGS